jgi:hypothetical protein
MTEHAVMTACYSFETDTSCDGGMPRRASMSDQNFVAAIIHGQLGQTLAKVFNRESSENPFSINLGSNQTLVEQLAEDGDNLPRIGFGIALDVLPLPVSALLAAPATGAGRPALLERARAVLGGQTGLFERQREAIGKLIDAPNPESLREAADGLFRGVVAVFKGPSGTDDEPTRGCLERLHQFFGNDIGTALPFATIINAVPQALQGALKVPRSVEEALLAYFFQPAGYKTVDGESVVSPVHLSDIRGAVTGIAGGADPGGQLRGLFAKTTAERYLRDMTRITVESAFDAIRDLKQRYSGIESELKDLKTGDKDKEAIAQKFVAWLRGFASMSESASMRAVEVGTQGVSQFQTNPLIAAAAGSFAGTVARKLAQDSFLGVLRNELDKKKTP